MGGAQPTQSAVIKNEHIPERNKSSPLDELFAPTDTQETKLRKVREELLESIRKHQHDDIRGIILSNEQKIAKLEKDVQLLLSVVTSHSNQLNSLANKDLSKADNETNPVVCDESGRVPGYIVVSSAINKLRIMGISRVLANTTTVAEYLIKRGYLRAKYEGNKTHAKYEIIPSKDNVIIKNPNYSNYVYNRSGYASEYMIKVDYVNSIMIPYFLKVQSQIESLEQGGEE